eukprot:5737619-Pleurochrysis_carterae.AAC.1
MPYLSSYLSTHHRTAHNDPSGSLCTFFHYRARLRLRRLHLHLRPFPAPSATRPTLTSALLLAGAHAGALPTAVGVASGAVACAWPNQTAASQDTPRPTTTRVTRSFRQNECACPQQPPSLAPAFHCTC